MKILITAPGQFTGDSLKVGRYYNADIADEGSDAQNKTFHALLQCYWQSGCHSYNARNFPHFKVQIKMCLGAGKEKFTNLVNEDGTYCPEGRPDYRVKSWRDYTKKERQSAIDSLIAEMEQAEVQTAKFYEILNGMGG